MPIITDNPDTPIKVVALDPGITTGYAVGMIEDGAMGVISGQAKWNEFELLAELRRSNPDIIVYETFEYRSEKLYGKKGGLYNVELFSRNLIGVINLYVSERAVSGKSCGCYTQKPAQAVGKMPQFPDKKLKEHMLFKVDRPHANDACRHLLYWFTFGAGYQYNKKEFYGLA